VHGELNGKLLEHVVAFNYNAAKEKYDVIHKLLLKYGYKHGDLPNQIHEFIESIRPNTLVHHDKSDLSSISDYVLKDPCVVTNPREVNKDEVIKIYEKIFK
jgi:alcohol dehydrogenase class IV